MNNKVVFRAAAALNDAGLTVLRVNFRGVGQSTGAHDMGQGELEDVRASLDYLSERFPGEDLTLAGFSFGARVGTEVGIGDPRVARLISIGTPIKKYDFAFLRNCRKPILFVHGANDEFGDVEGLLALVESLPAEAEAKLVIVEGADHFFEGHLDELKQAIAEWIKARLRVPAS